VFVPGTPSQPSFAFLGKVMRLPKSGEPERCFTWVGSGLTHRHQAKLEKPARNKHSTLLTQECS